MPQVATIWSWTTGSTPKGWWAGYTSSAPGEVFSDGFNVTSASCYVHSYNGYFGYILPMPRTVYINGQPIACVGWIWRWKWISRMDYNNKRITDTNLYPLMEENK